MHLRHATHADIPAMIELERSSSAAHWTRQHYEARLGGTERAYCLALVAESASESSRMDEDRERSDVVAFLIAHRIEMEWEVENIVVEASVRRQRIGFSLLEKLAKHVQENNGVGIFLEVRESNLSARALYGKVGFEEVGRRAGYYSNPVEDAIICRMGL